MKLEQKQVNHLMDKRFEHLKETNLGLKISLCSALAVKWLLNYVEKLQDGFTFRTENFIHFKITAEVPMYLAFKILLFYNKITGEVNE